MAAHLIGPARAGATLNDQLMNHSANHQHHPHRTYPIPHKGGCYFSVWAPEKKTMTLHLLTRGRPDTGIAMQKDDQGYFVAEVEGATAGDRYYYIPEEGQQYPDPCSQYQPEGLNGPSQVVDHTAFSWQDGAWRGKPLAALIFYEIHVGTFTPEGTFEAIIPRLDDLVQLGVNALELMPVAQNPGTRNWGYDGVYLYAVQHNYGGPDGLKKLVDACHRRGLAVFLDVVYNHLGREGNCLEGIGPYFSGRYHTPWGKALNFDDAWSDGVRAFVTGNVLHWAQHYHLDGLRLDAVHEIYDRNAVSIWENMQASVRQWTLQSGRPFYLIAESDLNDPRTVQPTTSGGQGFDAQWLDDFHHALYVLLDSEARRNYGDYGELQQFARAYTEGFVFTGEYANFRHRRHGASSANLPPERFVIFNQNHDLPGNRPGGERLSMLVNFERLKLAAAAVLLSPYLPMLFMGEEYGERTPFYFFSDYSQPQTAATLREERKKQFEGFGWTAEAPDPQQKATFLDCILKWSLRRDGIHRQLLEWHRRLISLRKTHPLLAGNHIAANHLRADLLGTTGLAIVRHAEDLKHRLLILFNFSCNPLTTTIPYGDSDTAWTRLLASTVGAWAGENAACPPPPHMISTGQPVQLPPCSASVYEWRASRPAP
jgi:maltooligosyltrehalose trehalohydrolase